MKNVALVLSLLASTAYAGSNTGNVAWISTDVSNGRIVFEMSNVTTSPACGAGSKQFTIDGTSAGGKIGASAIYMAKETGKQVVVTGGAIGGVTCVGGIENAFGIRTLP